MNDFRYPDGSLPRPIKEVAAAICCICGTAMADQVECLYHASGHFREGLDENTNHLLRCRRVPCAFLAGSEEAMACHIRGHEEFNLLNGDKSINKLFELLRRANPLPRPSTPQPPPPLPPSPPKAGPRVSKPRSPQLGPKVRPDVVRRVAPPEGQRAPSTSLHRALPLHHPGSLRQPAGGILTLCHSSRQQDSPDLLRNPISTNAPSTSLRDSAAFAKSVTTWFCF